MPNTATFPGSAFGRSVWIDVSVNQSGRGFLQALDFTYARNVGCLRKVGRGIARGLSHPMIARMADARKGGITDCLLMTRTTNQINAAPAMAPVTSGISDGGGSEQLKSIRPSYPGGRWEGMGYAAWDNNCRLQRANMRRVALVSAERNSSLAMPP
jgi:hypothetical protein